MSSDFGATFQKTHKYIRTDFIRYKLNCIKNSEAHISITAQFSFSKQEIEAIQAIHLYKQESNQEVAQYIM